eukprot:TRINITY_DN10053_c0_g1_i1.p1 TRINITY_DN10053_c0_g1~~TRINITY_DN10053_c0_g1_i1.p1  ORF type:complete len:317 (+),score=40.62 TRINITY_DN10053_c0_g1_i1:66-953(+)
MAQATESIPKSSASNAVPNTSEDSSSPPRKSVSLLALLRASRRIQEMKGRSGDLCALTGCLYSQANYSVTKSCEASGDWAPVLSIATFKVVAAVDKPRRYSLEVESRLPLSQQEGSPLPAFRATSVEEQLPGVGLNAKARLDFPVEAALDASLVTTGHLALPAGPSRCYSRDLGVDSLSLVWSEIGSATTPPSQLEAGKKSGYPSSSSGVKSRRFAFVFDGPSRASVSPGSPEVRSCGSEMELALTPVDALYLARLCALDDENPASRGSIDVQRSTPPAHLLTSDEVLSSLLCRG